MRCAAAMPAADHLDVRAQRVQLVGVAERHADVLDAASIASSSRSSSAVGRAPIASSTPRSCPYQRKMRERTRNW